MLNKLKKSNKGFTIIEVMIVLAIAGLILLIVFLAVPALQRSSHNTSRKNDAANISAAIATYETNNSGTLPPSFGPHAGNTNNLDVCSSGGTTASGVVGATACSGNIETANLGFYTANTVWLNFGETSGSNITVTASSTASTTVVTTNSVLVVPHQECISSSTGQYNPRSVAVWYAVESGGNANGVIQCVSN